MKNTIYLTGFMGSGKSTIGPILANTLGWDFFDLDKIIENKTEKKIREIFEQHGESYFRKLETDTLKEISGSNNVVVSLGGGTVANEENLEVLKKTGKIIYLKVSLETVYKRLRYKKDRPALTKSDSENISREEMVDRINKLMNKRAKYYEQADYIIDTDSGSIGKTIDKIVKIISQT
ncbi:MAG: shikimate kinase [Ignavibacteria bacterium GWA2_35_9]|nr:MAG: shikimate kinase [Ignavibacteria bacterium GWA2_35_9]OGU45635.1 MAG: shikimate kinase [Ignavibacteria bacterium GWB2_36_8]OGU51925.1 MAG: shikimate kinase [Ignavibacteria bacterium GWC2_36_12]